MTRFNHALLFSACLAASCFSRGQAAKKPAPASPLAWRNVTSNVGGSRWGYGGVTTIAAVPGSDEVIAGVSERGLWSTKDGGLTWTQLGEDGQIKCRPYQI